MAVVQKSLSKFPMSLSLSSLDQQQQHRVFSPALSPDRYFVRRAKGPRSLRSIAVAQFITLLDQVGLVDLANWGDQFNKFHNQAVASRE